MIESLKNTFKETLIAIAPICFLVVLTSLIFKVDTLTIDSFLLSAFLLIIGITLFTFGADISMMLIGEKLGNKLIKSKKIFLIIFITFLIGIFVTLAEPDLRVLASQISSIPSTRLIIFVSLGVGIFLSIAALKILFKLDLNKILIISYMIVFALVCFVPSDFIPISFDSSGVTTGPISVPFILALGLGLNSFKKEDTGNDDGFGLIGLCSIGPKIMVLILGILFAGTNSFDTNVYTNKLALSSEFIICLKEILISMSPIIAIFIIIKLFTSSFNIKQTKKIIIGLISTLLGLCLFLTGVNYGFMNEGFILGEKFINLNHKEIIIPFIMILGFLVVFAEPAIKILTEKVEEVTEGSIKENVMKTTISIGVAIAVLISVIRIYTGISILYFLVPGYILSILLMIICPKVFTALGFDAGGCVCGPLTATFILPLLVGVTVTLEGNIYTDAFGLIALVALSPIIMVQLLGTVFKIKTRVKIYKDIDEEIIDYDWRPVC